MPCNRGVSTGAMENKLSETDMCLQSVFLQASYTDGPPPALRSREDSNISPCWGLVNLTYSSVCKGLRVADMTRDGSTGTNCGHKHILGKK